MLLWRISSSLVGGLKLQTVSCKLRMTLFLKAIVLEEETFSFLTNKKDNKKPFESYKWVRIKR